jgi:uncharacterized protein (TIGR03086 family)
VELLIALDRASYEFGRRLAGVEDAWTRPTPCPDWDVRYLAAHVVGGNRFAVLILDGMAASDAVDEVMATPQLGDDAMGAWTTTAAAQRSAFHATSALERVIHHPLGEMSGRQFLELRIFDITVHAWDLARSLGVDERLEPALVDVVLGIIENGPPGMGFGIDALGTTSANTSPQARLLDLTGRRGLERGRA